MNKLKTKIPPPVITLCFGLIMWAMSFYFPFYIIEHSYLFWTALVFIGMGVCLDVISFINFLKHKTTINPMYLGMAFILLGSAFLFGNIGSFLVLPFFILAMNYFQIKPEEKMLENNFGENYLEYKKSVRRWI